MSRAQGAAAALREIEARPKLRDKYNEALQASNDGSCAAVRAHIKLGHIGVEVKTHPRRLYGDRAVDLLGAALGMHRATFRRAMQVVEVFSAEQLREFEDRTSEGGHLITPGHLRVILPVPTDAGRRKLLELFYRKSLRVQDLAAKAGEMDGNIGDPQRSPPIKSMKGAVARLKAMAGTMKKNLEGEIDKVLFDQLRKFSAGKGDPTPEDAEMVEGVCETLHGLLDAVTVAFEEAEKSKNALEERLGVTA